MIRITYQDFKEGDDIVLILTEEGNIHHDIPIHKDFPVKILRVDDTGMLITYAQSNNKKMCVTTIDKETILKHL